LRVAFFEPDEDELTSHRKGTLFEHLARRLAELAGYREVTLRRKHRSLEYDIEGVSSLQGVRLLGEAKAHEDTISGKDLSGFVGKFLPKALTERVEGLFISTSPFTAEADDYLDGVREDLKQSPVRIHFRTLVGDEIARFFVENAAYASEGVLRSRLHALFGLEMLDAWLVVTERQDFFACSCGPNRVSAPTAFALFRTDGSELTLAAAYLDRLERQVDALLGLEPLGSSGASIFADRTQRLPPVVAGTGWFDYKFPTPPECFVGRTEALAEVRAEVAAIRSRRTAVRSIQILSRSGVGKSSLLVKLPEEIDSALSLTIDGRNLRTQADTRLIVTQAVELANEQLSVAIDVPPSLSEVNDALTAVAARLDEHDLVLLIQIDQFESTLTLPTVFNSVLDFVETATSQALPVVWIFARKNDLTATYDEGALLNLRRLNEISHSVGLRDFSPEEGRVLLDRLEEKLGQPLQPGLSQAISAFSGGFPWLHKRLCAHVLSMRDEGVSQRDLVQTGLRPEDLFEEDLAGLDEQDKALLRRIAVHLPTTAAGLSRHLEAEVSADRLTDRLNDFLGRKLLRRSGDIYDTYNDVFKTYLVSERVPFESRYVFRVAPRAAIKLLSVIREADATDLSSFQDHVGGSRIAVLNKLRDLRLLGLIEPKPGRVALTSETQSAMDREQLGDLLRKRMRGNALVLRVLDLVATEDEVDLEAVVGVLRRELPHVEVTPDTWRLYARTLANWLHFAGLAQLEGNVVRRQEIAPDESLLQGRAFSLGAFAPNTFVPSVRPEALVKLCRLLKDGPIDRARLDTVFSKQLAPGVVRDAVSLDLAREVDGAIETGRQGRALLDSGREISRRDVAQLALSKPNVKALLDAATPGPLGYDEQVAVVRSFGSAKWSDRTWAWRLGILRAWLYETGQVRNLRGKGITAS
jgi:Holliday junction resolvasome RuvABC ATP-dependent DNA helicase subunit